MESVEDVRKNSCWQRCNKDLQPGLLLCPSCTPEKVCV